MKLWGFGKHGAIGVVFGIGLMLGIATPAKAQTAVVDTLSQTETSTNEFLGEFVNFINRPVDVTVTEVVLQLSQPETVANLQNGSITIFYPNTFQNY